MASLVKWFSAQGKKAVWVVSIKCWMFERPLYVLLEPQLLSSTPTRCRPQRRPETPLRTILSSTMGVHHFVPLPSLNSSGHLFHKYTAKRCMHRCTVLYSMQQLQLEKFGSAQATELDTTARSVKFSSNNLSHYTSMFNGFNPGHEEEVE